MSSFVSVIGTVFVDCKGFAVQSYTPQGRNLGNIKFVHGGVGRNIAENLASLDLSTNFVSSIDQSALGTDVRNRLTNIGVCTDYLAAAPSEGMGMWLAILDETGNLAGSISQMPNLAALDSTIQAKGSEIMKKSSHIALELDLNEQLSKQIIDLAEQNQIPVYGIPGNLDVILKNPGLLPKLASFICNEFEAEKVISPAFNTLTIEDMIAELQRYVDSTGAASMVVTLGARGSIYYDARSKQSGYQNVFPVNVVDSSGAGDAFFSGTVMGLVRGLPLGDAVVCGTKVAGWTIESEENNCKELSLKIRNDEIFQKLLVK
jgi:pseudouridine kinase